MMKRVLSALLFTVILLSACSQQAAPTWQEQYDLGIRYLSEGHYQEAIIAFTAAIEIDPKRAPAYVGRGDSYLLSGESEENLKAAREDYKQAISLDKLAAEVYGKLADVYMALGDLDGAMAILQQGYDATGDEALLGRLEELQEDKPSGASETVVAEGYFFHNPDVYRDSWESYMKQYQHDKVFCSITSYGIRFIQPVDVTVAGKAATISEAAPCWEPIFDYLVEDDTMIDRPLRITGYFYLNEQTTELEGPTVDEETNEIYYHYRPNGDYNFCVTGVEEIDH